VDSCAIACAVVLPRDRRPVEYCSHAHGNNPGLCGRFAGRGLLSRCTQFGTIKNVGSDLTRPRCGGLLGSGGEDAVTVKVEWQQEDGTVATAELARIDSDALYTAADLGLKLSDTKPILAQIWSIVTNIQARSRSYCESVRSCPSCRTPRRVKDHRERRLDGMFGTVVLRAPRFERCRACDCAGTYSPLTEL
jgi:hypothetical protein